MTKTYSVKKVSDLKLLLQYESRSAMNFDVQLKGSDAFVYYLPPGKVVLLPGNLSDNSQGILFYDKNYFEDCVRLESFPVTNSPIAIEEEFQNEVMALNSKMKVIIAFMSNHLTDTSGSVYSLLLKARAINVGQSKREMFYSALLLGESIRQAKSGNWILLKNYGAFNPYFTPAILYPDGSVLHFRDKVDLFFEGSMSFENFLKMNSIENPPFKLKADEFQRRYQGYKILD